MSKCNALTVACCIAAIPVGSLPQPAAASETSYSGFFPLYEANRREGVPNYVTEDFLAQAYAMLVEDAATRFEERDALPALLELAPLLRSRIGSSTEPEKAAQGFLAVFEALLVGAAVARGAPDTGAADREIEAVEAATGIARSPLLRQQIDYSQFRVRGKYTHSPELGRYFRAARYAGTALFPLLHSRATGVGAADADVLTGAAMLISRAVKSNARAAKLYARASEPLDYLFGMPDAMTVAQYAQRLTSDSGDLKLGGAALPRLRLSLFAAGVRPRVLGAHVDAKRLEPGVELADALAGWQFLPARLTPESAAFQELVFDRVGEFRGRGQPFTMGMIDGRRAKAFPSVLELAALLGSEEAVNRLRRTEEADYEGYAEARERAARALGLPAGLASEHVALVRHWLQTPAEGTPRAAPERRLNTALGFWTLLRHGVVLHAKQSYTPSAKGLPPAAPERSRAWIEPAESLYRALARSARQVARRTEFDRLAQYADLADRCADLSRQALAGKFFDAEQTAYLNSLDTKLLQLTGRQDAPVVVDFHTDGNSGQVAEIALGTPQVAEVRFREGGRGRGGLFRLHQFKQPLGERLDDQAWAGMVARGEAPAPLLRATAWKRAGAALLPGRKR